MSSKYIERYRIEYIKATGNILREIIERLEQTQENFESILQQHLKKEKILSLFISIINKNYKNTMGQGQSHPLPQYQQFNVNHSKFQNKKVQLINQDVIVTKVIQKKQYESWQNYLKRAPSDHEYLLMPHHIEYEPNNCYCGGKQTGLIKIIFQDFSQILQKEIKDRALENKQYEQTELWYILYSLTKGVSAFHQKREKCGDIRPMNVFIRGNGQIKLYNHFTWPETFKTNYEKTFYQSQITYLSPEEMNQLAFSSKGSPNSDQILSQSFSVGLTCLDCVLLTNSTDLYGQKIFNKNKFEQRLDRLRQKTKYSQGLIYLIRNLCHISSKQRLKCSEVVQMLRPYEDNILDMRHFELPYRVYQPNSGRKEVINTPKKILQATYRNDDSISPKDSRLNESREERQKRKSKRYSYQQKYLESIEDTEKKVHLNIKESNRKYR